MMKLPLPWGIALLAGIWAGYEFVEEPAMRSLLLVVAMGITLWTAFSLNIPPRSRPEEEDEPRVLHDEQDDEPPPPPERPS